MRLDVAEAAGELLVRRTQRALRIDLQMAGDVGDDEQEIAELLLDRMRDGGSFRVCCNRLLELGELLLELHQNRRQRRPVEADLRRFVLQLDRARESRQ